MPMTRDQFIRSFFIVLLVFIVYQLFLIFSPFYNSIFWAAILAFAFFPMYVRIRKDLLSHETLAALLSTIIIILIVIPPVVYVVVNLTSQAIQLYQTASDYVREGKLGLLVDQVRSMQAIQNLQNSEIWTPLKDNLSNWLLRASKELGNFTAMQVGVVTKNILFITINFLLTVFLLFIFLRDGEKIYHFVYASAPLEEKNKKPLFHRIHDTLVAVLRGQILSLCPGHRIWYYFLVSRHSSSASFCHYFILHNPHPGPGCGHHLGAARDLFIEHS
jgi:predicted PurR-regulated permease PerM